MLMLRLFRREEPMRREARGEGIPEPGPSKRRRLHEEECGDDANCVFMLWVRALGRGVTHTHIHLTLRAKVALHLANGKETCYDSPD